MNNDRRDGKFVLGLFLGGLLGALIIFFLGTKDGKKTAKEIEKKSKEAIDDVLEKLDELQEKGEALKEQVVEQIVEKKDALTEVASGKIDSALKKIEEIQEHGRQTTAHLRREFKNLPKR